MKIKYGSHYEVAVDADGEVVGRAPDGNYGQRLLGFSITSTPKPTTEAHRPPAFYHANALPEDLTELVGYYAQFVGAKGDMYGWAEPVWEVTR